MKTIKKTKMITMGFVALFTMAFTQPSFSYSKSENPVELRSIGSLNHSPLFELKANSTEISEYSVKVKDLNGTVLCTEIVKEKHL